MAITWVEKTAGNSGVTAQSYATASVTPVANRGYLLWVESGLVGGATVPTSVTGMGVTWVLVDSQGVVAANPNVMLSLWRAMSPTPGAGAITIGFGVAHTGCSWKLLEGNGVSTAGTNGSGMIRAGSVAKAPTTSSAPAVTLPSAPVAGDGVMCGIAYNAGGTNTITAGTGFAKLGVDQDPPGSPAAQLSVEWATPGTATVGWTTTNSNNKALLAFEAVASAVPVSLSSPADQTADAYDTVTLSWAASNGTAPYSHAVAQVSGSPSSTLSGVGGTRTFTAPATLAGAVQTFRDTVTDAAAQTASDDVVVTTAAHNVYTQRGSVLVPQRPFTRRAGVLVG